MQEKKGAENHGGCYNYKSITSIPIAPQAAKLAKEYTKLVPLLVGVADVADSEVALEHDPVMLAMSWSCVMVMVWDVQLAAEAR